MFSSIRRHFGTAGLVVSIVALVAALAGGAIAATGGSDGGKATASKAKKGPRGPKGPKGDPGPVGPQGPAGANGKDGTNGSNGSNGSNGATGATGPTGSTGVTGNTGSTGVVSTEGPLGSGKTETGGWTIGNGNNGEFPASGNTAISFPIPLGLAPGVTQVQSNNVGFPTGGNPEDIEHCPGSVAEPKAKTGFLCVYTGVLEHNNPALTHPTIKKLSEDALGADKIGARLQLFPEAGAGGKALFGSGTWAVTG